MYDAGYTALHFYLYTCIYTVAVDYYGGDKNAHMLCILYLAEREKTQGDQHVSQSG